METRHIPESNQEKDPTTGERRREFDFDVDEDAITGVFERAGWNAQVKDAERESDRALANLHGESVGEGPLDETGELLLDTREQLEENSESMRSVIEEVRREMEAEVASIITGKETSDEKVAALEALAMGGHSEIVLDALAAFGDKLEFGQKARVAATAVEHDPETASSLDSAGFSDAERRAVLFRVASQAPKAFLGARIRAGLDFNREELRAITLMTGEANPQAFAELAGGLGFSHDDIVDMLGELPEAVRTDAIEAFRIPGAKGGNEYEDVTFDDAGRREKIAASPELRDWFELVVHTERASRDLMLAIAEEFPERADRDLERYLEERSLHGKIENFGELGLESKTAPLFVNIEDRELPAVYKPLKREAVPFDDGRMGTVRTGIELGGMSRREVLAYLIDRATGLDLVPTTVLRDGPEGIGSVQEWNVGRTGQQLEDPLGWQDPKYRGELTRVGYADYLKKRSDGHMGNVLVTYDGKFKMIDNGTIFAKQVSIVDGLNSDPLIVVKGSPIAEEDRRKTKAFLASTKTREALQRSFSVLLGSVDGEQFWGEFIGRMEQGAEESFVLPDNDWMSPDDPEELKVWMEKHQLTT